MILVGTTAFLVPLILSWLLCAQMIHWAPSLRLIDQPTERKAHGRIVPLGGGIAIFGAVCLTFVLVIGTAWLLLRFPAIQSWVPEILARHSRGVLSMTPLLGIVLGASAIQMLLGLMDDLFGLPFWVRLVAEILLVLLLTCFGIRLAVLPGWEVITIPLTVLWIVGLTNALNFLDNMDGLSGGVAALASLFFAATSLLVGDLFVAGCFLLLAGSLVGFLVHNWPPAKIFMGDAGSNFLGFWLGVLTVISTFKTEEYSYVTLLAPLCILAVPIYDSSTVILLRLSQGRSPFQADRQHFSHRLVELGFRPLWAVLLIYLLTFATGLSGLILYFVEPKGAAIVLLQLAATLGVLAILELATWRRRDSLERNDH
ncbi:undecaprenyl/decaprenyl-phosphate alpha-N-acetylglucosaminyl 1-phosphate transferase [bacterium]|nr:undecaprenyl/decaprenyl-phosphate alpha-N-acetylglucosaminyl 1-phosphate transferase [bacterium]